MNEILLKLSAEKCTDFEIYKTQNMVNLMNGYMNNSDLNLYYTYFSRIPNCIRLDSIDCKKAMDWFEKNYQDVITDCCYTKRGFKRKKINFEEVYLFLFDDLLVYLNHFESIVRVLFRKTDHALVDKIVHEMKQFPQKRERRKPEIEILLTTDSGLTTLSMEITKPKFSIKDNYNDDFLPIHQTILGRLSNKKEKGLILLHGKPGTGKTSYIRYLITQTKKPVIFLPPNLAAGINDPKLMDVLIMYPNSIFVIEDAESIIIDRNRNGSSSSVAAFLNLADGLLSDCLNIQIICSFNTDLSRVDSALTRKGRLIAQYEFSELDVPKAQALSNKLGFSSTISSPMTLAAVYNQHEKDFSITSQRKRIGFNITA